jgi:hypothetical protein
MAAVHPVGQDRQDGAALGLAFGVVRARLAFLLPKDRQILS